MMFEVDYYGSISSGALLVAPAFWGVSSNIKTYMVIGSYIYVINDNSNEVMLYSDNKLYRLYEAYTSDIVDDELLSEIAVKLNLAVYPTPTGEVDSELVDELKDLISEYEVREGLLGVARPYSMETFVRLNAAYQIAESVIADISATNDDYLNAINKLSSAMDNICIDEYFAKQTYVLSLEENNENGFYDEAKWSDFTAKRDELRDSFKTNDEKTISDAYLALYNSFTDMTSGYLSGDVNNDGTVNVDDVTLIQKYLADITTFTGVQVELAACYCTENQYADGRFYDYGFVPTITVDNATVLQKSMNDPDSMINRDLQYGEIMVDSYGIEYNSKICLSSMSWDSRSEAVWEKIEELEAEGII